MEILILWETQTTKSVCGTSRVRERERERVMHHDEVTNNAWISFTDSNSHTHSESITHRTRLPLAFCESREQSLNPRKKKVWAAKYGHLRKEWKGPQARREISANYAFRRSIPQENVQYVTENDLPKSLPRFRMTFSVFQATPKGRMNSLSLSTTRCLSKCHLRGLKCIGRDFNSIREVNCRNGEPH